MICRRDECGQDSDNCPCPDECYSPDSITMTEAVIFALVAAILLVMVAYYISSQVVLT